MKKSVLILIPLIAIALGAIYIVSHHESVPEGVESAMVPEDGGDEGNGSTEGQVTAPTIEPTHAYEVNADESAIDFTGYKVGGKQEVSFFDFGGSLKAAPGEPTSLQMDIAVILESAVHENDMFLRVLKGEHFFNIEEHPEAIFVSDSVVADGETFKVTGDLTLRGITKKIKFPASISIDESTVTVQAEFTVNRKQWGIDYKGRGDAFIQDDVLMVIDLIADVGEG